MIYNRKGRDFLYAELRVRFGYKQLCLFTTDKKMAANIEQVWNEIIDRHRAWDVIQTVPRERNAAELYDLYIECNRDITLVRERLADVDLIPLVDDFMLVYGRRVTARTAEMARKYIDYVLPPAKPFLRSQATAAYLTRRIYEYKGGERNRNKTTKGPGASSLYNLHSHINQFFKYATKVRGIYRVNPMVDVPMPKTAETDIRFYELEDVLRIIHWQPTPQRKAFFALIYGAGTERSAALRLRGSDIISHRKEIRSRGTKTHTRDRISLVSDWAWEIFWPYARTIIHEATLFDEWGEETWYRWHRNAIEALKLPRLAMHCARHHWAVRQLRAGVPIHLVQHQLGHKKAQMTLDTYGRFIPSSHDRAIYEKQVAEYDKKRKGASS